MPCRDWDPTPGPTIQYVETGIKPSLLCEACALLEEAGVLKKASKELRAWYKMHEAKEADKVRLEAAQKLSERERRLLGIDLAALQSKVK